MTYLIITIIALTASADHQPGDVILAGAVARMADETACIEAGADYADYLSEPGIAVMWSCVEIQDGVAL